MRSLSRDSSVFSLMICSRSGSLGSLCRVASKQAIDADPSYALAYAGLAEYYGFMAYSGEMPTKEAWPKMEAAALHAAQLDPNLAGVHESLAAVSFLYKWDWATTEREIKRALALDPNGAEAHGLYSIYIRTMHRFDEALKEAKRAWRHIRP